MEWARIGGFCNLYIGQEAVRADEDWHSKGRSVITGSAIMGHNAGLWNGSQGVMAALTETPRRLFQRAKAAPCQHVQQGKNFFRWPRHCGRAGFARTSCVRHRYRGNDSVSLGDFRDGASNQASLMRASTWRSFGSSRNHSIETTVMRWHVGRRARPLRPTFPKRVIPSHHSLRASRWHGCSVG